MLSSMVHKELPSELEGDEQVQQQEVFVGDDAGQELDGAGVLREVCWHSSGPPQFARDCPPFPIVQEQ